MKSYTKSEFIHFEGGRKRLKNENKVISNDWAFNIPSKERTVMEIIEDLIPESRGNRPKSSIDGPKFITVHDTGNSDKGTDALNHARYLKGNEAANAPKSWHYTVDDIRVVQHLPLTERGFHTGDGMDGPGNKSSIGIEICQNVDGDRAKAEANAIALIAKLLTDLKLDVSAVVQHHKWTGKDCPHIIRERPAGWTAFIKAIELAILKPQP